MKFAILKDSNGSRRIEALFTYVMLGGLEIFGSTTMPSIVFLKWMWNIDVLKGSVVIQEM